MLIDPEDIAYAAAFIEADGCIQLTGVKVTNRCLEVLTWFETTFGGQIRPKVVPEGCWEWTIHGEEAEVFIDLVYLSLKFKKPQADLFKVYRTTIQKRGTPLSSAVLNKREILSEKMSEEKARWKSHT